MTNNTWANLKRENIELRHAKPRQFSPLFDKPLGADFFSQQRQTLLVSFNFYNEVTSKTLHQRPPSSYIHDLD